jgi:hypothetical protein
METRVMKSIVNSIILVIALVFVSIFGCSEKQSDKKPKELKGAYDAQKALALIYGSLEWNDKKLSEYFKDKTVGYISLDFDSIYTEGGKEKHFVIAHITPSPIEEYRCHACTPLVGGAVFAKSKNGWVVESENKVMGWGNAFGEDFKLEKIGADKAGLVLRIQDVHQGYENKSTKLFISYNGKLNPVLEVGFGESPGPGACMEGAEAQSINVRFEPGNQSEYFDAVADIQYNEGNCGKLVVKKQSSRYRFAGGKYAQIAQ